MSNPIFFRQGIRLPGIPISAFDAATKGYVDDLIGTHTHSQYALTAHTHSQYALTAHTHTQYAAVSHTHSLGDLPVLDTTFVKLTGVNLVSGDFRLSHKTAVGEDTLSIRLQSGGGWGAGRGALLELNGANSASYTGGFRLQAPGLGMISSNGLNLDTGSVTSTGNIHIGRSNATLTVGAGAESIGGGLANYGQSGTYQVGVYADGDGGSVRLRPDGRLTTSGELFVSKTSLLYDGKTVYHAGNTHTHAIEQVDGLAAALANATAGLTPGTAYLDAFGSASEYYQASATIDLNAVGRGRKILASSQALTNGPPHSGITFWHIETRTIYGADDTRLVQIATSYNGPHVIYTRRLFGDVWSAWIRILDSNMTVNDIAGTLSIANGGTGGTTQAAALTNLGAASAADAWGRGQTGPTLVSFSGDLNDCSGFHALYAGTSATNRPPSNAAVIGFGTTGYTQQMAMRNGTFNIRSQENGTWGAWDRVVTQDGSHSFTGLNNYGLTRSFTGAAGTQTIVRTIGWSNQATRWADVMEADGSYSIFSYTNAGGGAKAIFNMSTTSAGGTDKLTIHTLVESRNITVGSTADCSITCAPTSGRAVRFAATSNGNTGFYDVSNAAWLIQVNSANLTTLAGGLTVNGASTLTGNVGITGNTTMSGYGYVNGGRIYGATELNLVGGSSTSVIRIRPQGWTSTGQTQFNANGTVTFTGALTAPDYILSSDIRLKSNIDALDNRGRIEPIVYDMNDRRELGVSAQQIQKHWPEAVVEKDDGYLAVAYDRLIPVLAEQGNRTEDEVIALRKENASLSERLLLLEAIVLKKMG